MKGIVYENGKGTELDDVTTRLIELFPVEYYPDHVSVSPPVLACHLCEEAKGIPFDERLAVLKASGRPFVLLGQSQLTGYEMALTDKALDAAKKMVSAPSPAPQS